MENNILQLNSIHGGLVWILTQPRKCKYLKRLDTIGYCLLKDIIIIFPTVISLESSFFTEGAKLR